MNKRYLTINSVERYQGNSPADFIVKLRHSIKENNVELIECFIPNTFYNITTSNNTLLINNVPSQITPGNYNLDELFQQIVNDVANVTNITFNDITGIITITTGASVTLSFPQDTGGIAHVIGFSKTYSQTGTSFNSSRGPSLTYHNVYVEITELSSNHMTTNDYYHSPTFIITNNTNKNGIIQWFQKSQYHQKVNKRDNKEILNTLTIRLKNQFGEILTNCSEWTMVLSFY